MLPDSKPKSFLPSGDQIGMSPSMFWPFRGSGSEPSRLTTTKVPRCSSAETRTKAIFAPSGDQLGHHSSSELFEIFRSSVPSALMVQTSCADGTPIREYEGSSPAKYKRRVPSGDHWGFQKA